MKRGKTKQELRRDTINRIWYLEDTARTYQEAGRTIEAIKRLQTARDLLIKLGRIDSANQLQTHIDQLQG
jgi:hypothetical protein